MKDETRPASDVAFTPAVKSSQERLGSRNGYARMERGRGWSRTITAELAGFIADRNSLYLGTASADGQPYIQHRGGKRGFLKVLDEQTLGFADLAHPSLKNEHHMVVFRKLGRQLDISPNQVCCFFRMPHLPCRHGKA